jgi:hypothetical protein
MKKQKFNPKATHCCECGANWVQSEIPEEHREYYSPPYFFSRLIAIYDRSLDRTVEYLCPDCNARFPRED